jgi:hypothetical protein
MGQQRERSHRSQLPPCSDPARIPTHASGEPGEVHDHYQPWPRPSYVQQASRRKTDLERPFVEMRGCEQDFAPGVRQSMRNPLRIGLPEAGI